MKRIFQLLIIGTLFTSALTSCEKPAADAPDTRNEPAVNPITCTVEFDRGDGVIVDEQNLPAGEYLARPADPTREGYVFDGWTKDIAGDNPWKFDEETVYCSMLLHAQWTPQDVRADQNSSIKNSLDAAIAAAAAQSPDGYSDDSFVHLLQMIEQARTVSDDDSATRVEVEIAIRNLEYALVNLVVELL